MPNGEHTHSEEENSALLLKTKFPKDIEYTTETLKSFQGSSSCTPAITNKQITQIIQKIPNRSIPGWDGISYKSIKLMHQRYPLLLGQLYTTCLSLGYFSDKWKLGVVVFIEKSGKNLTTPNDFRPITLLPTLGKTFERCLHSAISSFPESSHFLHPKQYGFRSKHQEEFYLTAVISLDIKGAFDHAR